MRTPPQAARRFRVRVIYQRLYYARRKHRKSAEPARSPAPFLEIDQTIPSTICAASADFLSVQFTIYSELIIKSRLYVLRRLTFLEIHHTYHDSADGHQAGDNIMMYSKKRK